MADKIEPKASSGPNSATGESARADAISTPGRRAPKRIPITIISNVPQALPILPTEVALIAAWWPVLADAILANDNAECEPSGESGI